MRRRTFLKVSTALGAGGLLGAKLRAGPTKAPSPVFVAASADMYSADTEQKRRAIGQGLDSCAVELARSLGALAISRVGQAWEKILGAVTSQTRIAVHVTCFFADLNNINSPQIETLQALVAGLCDMLEGTFPAANIAIFDNDMSGIHRPHAVYGAAALEAMGVEHQDNAWDGSSPMQINGRRLYPHIYFSRADYVINVARLSGHQYAPGSGPGITGCVKGIMGQCSTDVSTFTGIDGAFHDTNKIWRGHQDHWKLIKDKVKVNLLDMVYATRHERLAFSKTVGELCLGLDPCAVDGYGSAKLQELEAADPSWTTYPSLTIPEAVAAAVSGWSTEYQKVDCPIPPRYDASDGIPPRPPQNLRVDPA